MLSLQANLVQKRMTASCQPIWQINAYIGNDEQKPAEDQWRTVKSKKSHEQNLLFVLVFVNIGIEDFILEAYLSLAAAIHWHTEAPELISQLPTVSSRDIKVNERDGVMVTQGNL